MTKVEMANEIMKNVNWTQASKNNRIRHLGKKEDVQRIYEAYIKNPEKALFYASLL